MITELTINGKDFYSPLKIAPENSGTGRWITVLIGENGSRKSLLLRLIVESALGYRSYAGYHNFHSDATSLPKKIIAVSGTPLDRFPRAGSQTVRAIRRSSRYSRFFYFGQRSNNGMSGVAQCERSLVATFISNTRLLNERREYLNLIFERLSLEPSLRIKVKVNSSIHDFFSTPGNKSTRAFTLIIKKEINLLRERLGNNESQGSEFESIFLLVEDMLINRIQLFKKCLGDLDEDFITLSVSPSRQDVGETPLSFPEWTALLRAGIVEVSGVVFKRKEITLDGKTGFSSDLSGDLLSSGQWNWLSSFAGVALEVATDTLIIVDEPENSLHPAWQIEYVSMLEEICKNYSRCQVIIATHSPLIASGVSPQHGNVATLERDQQLSGMPTKSQELPSFYGWSATDVYEKLFNIRPRAKAFGKTTNEALAYISSGKEIPQSELIRLSTSIAQDAALLPLFDPMREVMRNVHSILNPDISEENDVSI